MNIPRLLADHAPARLIEIDEAIAKHVRAIQLLSAERVQVAMHVLIQEAKQ
jgi:hypothetical protein